MRVERTFHRFQIDFLRTQKPYQLFAGGSGVGKTTAAAMKLLIYAFEHPRCECLVGASTWETTKKIAVVALLKILDEIGTQNYYYEVGKNVIRLANGSIIHVKNLADSGKLKGFNLDFIWIDEGTEVKNPEHTFEQLNNRLRSDFTEYPKQLVITTNPGLRTHYLYKFFYEQFSEETKWRVSIPAYESKHLTKEYLDRLRSLSAHGRKLLYDAEWGDNEGQVYNLVDDDHIRAVEERYGMKYYLSFDYGYDPDPMVFLLVGLWKGRVSILDEMHFTRTLLNSTLRQKLRSFVGSRVIAGFTGDLSFPAMIYWVKREFNFRFIHTSKRRYEGWIRIADFLEKKFEDNGERLLTINRKCTETVKSLQSMIFLPSGMDAESATGWDHHADAVRYFVKCAIFNVLGKEK